MYKVYLSYSDQRILCLECKAVEKALEYSLLLHRSVPAAHSVHVVFGDNNMVTMISKAREV